MTMAIFSQKNVFYEFQQFFLIKIYNYKWLNFYSKKLTFQVYPIKIYNVLTWTIYGISYILRLVPPLFKKFDFRKPVQKNLLLQNLFQKFKKFPET